MALTLTPFDAHSFASALVNCATPRAFDESARRVGRARVAVRDDVRSCLRERDRNRRAQSRRSARHERHAVVQSELVENHLVAFSIQRSAFSLNPFVSFVNTFV